MRFITPVACIVAAGCTSSTERPRDVGQPACDLGAPIVEIGSGANLHAPLTDGDPVPVAQHPRGGWYVPVSFRATHVDAIVWARARVAEAATGEVLGETSERVQLVEVDACTGEYWGLEGFVGAGQSDEDASGALAPLDGAELEVTVTVENLDGSVGTSSVLGKACLGGSPDTDAGPGVAPGPGTPADGSVRYR